MTEEKGRFYDVFIYKFSENVNPGMMRSKLDDWREYVSFELRDIAESEPDEKLKLITSVINAERFRTYSKGKEKLCNVTLIMYSPRRYAAVVSYYDDRSTQFDIKRLLMELFNAREAQYLTHSDSREDCEMFWNRNLAGIPLISRKDSSSTYRYERMEEFTIEIDNVKTYSTFLTKGSGRIRALLADSLGKIMCFINDSNGVIGEDIRDNGKLARVPFYVPSGRTKEIVEKLSGLMSGAERYDNITYEQINENNNFDISAVTMFSQTFLYDQQYVQFFKNIRMDTLYRINAIAMSDTPVAVVFFAEPGRIRSVYFYDPGYFREYDVEGINKAVSVMFNDYLDGVMPTIDFAVRLKKASGADKRLLDAKISCLRASNLFRNYTDTELARVADKAAISGGVCQQCMINEDSQYDRIYLIVKGRIEVFGHDNEGMQRPLMILKEKELFGIESLLDDRKAKFAYRVYSDGALLMSIDPEDLWNEAAEHGEIMKELLGIQSKRLAKFERLWVIS